jgi:hypothetical protein
MGSFSIWHWIVLIVIFSPWIVGIAIFGWQRRVLLKHTQSGLTKYGYVGHSWTYAIFGWIVPIIRGEIGIGVLHLVLTIFTFGLFQFLMSCLYNNQQMTRLLVSGWELVPTDENYGIAKLRMGISG